MANMRKAGLKLVGAYVEEEYKNAFAVVAAQWGTDTDGAIREFIRSSVDAFVKTNPKSEAAERLKGR